MTLYKNVNGERIEISSQEESDIRAEWAANENPVMEADKIISEVNKRLIETDWTQLEDVNLTTPEKAQWASYRTLLRALDRTPRRGVVFPSPPSDPKRNGR